MTGLEGGAAQRLDDVEREVRELLTSMASIMETLVDLDDAVARLDSGRGGAGVTTADGAEDGAEDGPAWWAVSADAEAWVELARWVDDLVRTYELGDRVLACWPVHGGVVEELSALHSAWVKAASVPDPDDARASWHDRHLAPTLARLESSFYPIRNCREGHQKAPTAVLTDPELVPGGSDHQ